MACEKIRPVILAGGQGSRLWPLSQPHLPKQFLKLGGDKTLFQQTLLRLSGSLFLPPIIVCHQDHCALVASQLQQINRSPHGLIYEPIGRGTAPAALVAALHSNDQQCQDQLLLIAPSDHLIARIDQFHETVKSGIKVASEGNIVTFGINPAQVDSQYGYLLVADKIVNSNEAGPVTCQKVIRFDEKPSHQTAENYIRSGLAYWNAGVFLCRGDALISSGERYLPDILGMCRQALKLARHKTGNIFLDPQHYQMCPSLSLDHGIMEYSDQIYCYPLTAGWSDLGSWSSLLKHSPCDEKGNTANGDVVFVDSNGCYGYAVDGRRLTLKGLQDQVVIATDENIFVCDKKHLDQRSKFISLNSKPGNDVGIRLRSIDKVCD